MGPLRYTLTGSIKQPPFREGAEGPGLGFKDHTGDMQVAVVNREPGLGRDYRGQDGGSRPEWNSPLWDPTATPCPLEGDNALHLAQVFFSPWATPALPQFPSPLHTEWACVLACSSAMLIRCLKTPSLVPHPVHPCSPVWFHQKPSPKALDRLESTWPPRIPAGDRSTVSLPGKFSAPHHSATIHPAVSHSPNPSPWYLKISPPLHGP